MARETGSREREEGQQSGAVTRRRWRSPDVAPGASPFTLMRRMAEDLDRFFDDVGIARAGGWAPGFFGRDLWPTRDIEQIWAPEIETFRRDDQLVVRADLPGMKKEDVNVEVEDDALKISGERREEHAEERDDYYRSERSYGRFYRAIPLPEGVNTQQVNATFRDGVLEVTLPAPKEPPHHGRRIEIR